MDDGGTTQVWVVNRDGTGLRQVTSSAGQHWPHSWAPDNDRIAFAGERDGVWNVWTVSASTGVTQQLTRFTTPNGYVRYPAWSPLNDRIVFEHATVTANVWTGRLRGAKRPEESRPPRGPDQSELTRLSEVRSRDGATSATIAPKGRLR